LCGQNPESALLTVKEPAVYILTNRSNGVLYVGVTSDLIKRIWQHRNNSVEGFSQRYRLHLLVYFAQFESMIEAIAREKELKKWRRAWKVALIEQNNPEWRDLWPDLIKG
jgi:putative endonuclease